MYEMKQHKPWFNVGSFMTLNQTKQAKVQCLQHPNQSNVDNLNNVRREASRHDISGVGDLKAKIYELEINSKIKNVRDFYMGFSDFKKGDRPRTNIVQDEQDDLDGNRLPQYFR